MKKLKVDVTRHGNASGVPGVDNLWRPLSPLGVEQALAARSRYVSEKVALVLHSPAPRASCTAAIAVGDQRPPFVLVDNLWTYRNEPNGEDIWKSFETYGYEVEKYLSDPNAYSAMTYFGKNSSCTVRGEIASFADDHPLNDGDVIIVAGHAVVSNFLAYYLSGRKDDRLLKIKLGEAERIRLTFEDSIYTGFEYNYDPA